MLGVGRAPATGAVERSQAVVSEIAGRSASRLQGLAQSVTHHRFAALAGVAAVAVGALALAGCASDATSSDRGSAGVDGAGAGADSIGNGTIPATVSGVTGPSTSRTPRPQLSLTPVASGFDSPVGMASTPADPDALYVVEQQGRVIRRDLTTNTSSTVLDLSGTIAAGGEQGLLSIAFHPNFASNGRAFIDYTDMAGDVRVAEVKIGADHKVEGAPRDLLTVDKPYANHNGGQLQFGPDGMLYIGMGDGGGGGDPNNRAQNPNELLGKILRIDVDTTGPTTPYGIPADNPHADGGGRGEIWATGVRNPWRFSFDRSTGDAWIADVGQSAWEEINMLPKGVGAGTNLGWDRLEGTATYDENAVQLVGRQIDPVLQYGHDEGAAVVGGFVYRGKKFPELQGWYLYADITAQEIRGLKIENGSVVDRARWPGGEPMMVSFGEDAEGEMYVSAMSGEIYRITQ